MANYNGSDTPKPRKPQTAPIKHNQALTPQGRKLMGVAIWNGK